MGILSTQKAMAGSDIYVNVPTGDALLGTYSDFLVKWINPLGTQGQGVAVVNLETYLRIKIDDADLIAGDWFFTGQATDTVNDIRKTYSKKLTVLSEGQVL